MQVLGPDLQNGTPALLQSFANTTGATFPLLLLGATSTGGNLSTLYGPFDNYVVISKQGIVRYHAALTWPHGNRYHLNEIRGCIDTLVSVVAGVGPEPRATLGLTATPNPFRDATELAWTLPAPGGEVRLEVFDLSGRRVRRLPAQAGPSGMVRAHWDGRDANGEPVRAGVYLIRAAVGGHRVSRRIVRLE